MTTLEELKEIAGKLPTVFLKDINVRLTDWFSTGGKEEDNYVKQQLRFAKNCLKWCEENDDKICD
ncbi:hypothetical protein B9500_10325 [Listeria monocytogenes]|uniref:DUF6877 domain-containing protein n=1 Tax=Listeria monocytogenes TaxID=1639 RepID=A0A6Y6Q6N8_LISMN|nr:DUF6877 family protein [Listeria monocytogenes]EAC2203458.1 hypothetical protein [Listeria monocytogenes]EAC3631671.1 hypothetical protein [Listeria monocytogenes]EAC3643087.1 hypothetical protein [Listeria monocytogenes]EAC4105025.1 hypothetical protein [Listeria monocytogenes]EAC4357088.1 hypothetical protein [Listeria monocytogenes]